MASSKQEATAAAAEQLGSMSIGGSVERNDNETEPPTLKNGTNTKLLCSACGEKSNTLKKCNGCLCVWYCDKECQNKHRKEHRKECRPIKKELDKRGGTMNLGTELDVGPLGKVPPREECPICMRLPPIHPQFSAYYACCGKCVCAGCNHHHQIKMRERAGEKTCAFCRTKLPKSDEEALAQLRKQVERKDPQALFNMAAFYENGLYGLPVDQAKSVELLCESASQSYPPAQHRLGMFYRDGEMGLEKKEQEGLNYLKKAAEGGDVHALHKLGVEEGMDGRYAASMCNLRLSAAGGHRDSMEALIGCFGIGVLRHKDLAETTRAFYLARAEMKSDDRDRYIAHLKMTGEYRKECDL
jgi:TPR repeat protein